MRKTMGSIFAVLLMYLPIEAAAAPMMGIGAAKASSTQVSEKSVASGLYMSGQFTYVLNNGVASITLDQVNNDSPVFATGSLRLTLWATTYQPARGTAFAGTRLAAYPIASPLGVRSNDANIFAAAAFSQPPNGSYWLVMALEEYDPSLGCSADGWCMQDTFTSYLTITFGSALPSFDYSDLWWNPNESGWGVFFEQHPTNIAFVAWFAYDGGGNPKWYVGTNCPMVGEGCTGILYETTGPAFGPTFNPASVSIRPIGSVTFSFTDRNNGYMSYNVNGLAGVKTISREPF